MLYMWYLVLEKVFISVTSITLLRAHAFARESHQNKAYRMLENCDQIINSGAKIY